MVRAAEWSRCWSYALTTISWNWKYVIFEYRRVSASSQIKRGFACELVIEQSIFSNKRCSECDALNRVSICEDTPAMRC
jgi:hypothetical protein